MTYTNETHDPSLTSWVDSAAGSDFPIQNLPFGVFSTDADATPRIGVAIGDRILDCRAAVEAKLLESLTAETRCALCAEALNDFMGLGGDAWSATRAAISNLLAADAAALRDLPERDRLLPTQAEATMHLPARIGDYTDFYASIHHATNVGSMFRPDNPLMPNYKHLPVGYHGRASSIVIDGTPVRRPCGQTKADPDPAPVYGPCRLLDYELEFGAFIGSANELGTPVGIDHAHEHLFGVVILNDWSARDVQKWEYQPLGPFNAKNFVSSISPWVVTMEALAPFRAAGPPRGDDDPALLEYLDPAGAAAARDWALDIRAEVTLTSRAMREAGTDAVTLSRGSLSDMYWTFPQMLAHHTSTGCNMRPGDLIGSGTVSGPGEDSRGCLLELTWRGQNPVELPDGTQRKFLQDGDELSMHAWCEADGAVRIGLGACSGEVLPALVPAGV